MLTHYFCVGQLKRRTLIWRVTNCGHNPSIMPMGERLNSTPLRMETDLESSDLSARARQRINATWICSSDSSAFLPRIRAVCKVLGLRQAPWVIRRSTRQRRMPWAFPCCACGSALRESSAVDGRLAQVHRRLRLRAISRSSSRRAA